MNFFPGWYYNEMQQVGTDYTDDAQVLAYDTRMQKLRDIKKETREIIALLDINKNHTILEFGTGTGSFSIEIAKHCARAHAVDISPQMLELAKQKAKESNVDNIEFHNAGFLTYDHLGNSPDAVVSQLALHHLPDFWKLVALKRIYKMLKTDGKFYLQDTVYSFNVEDYTSFFNNWTRGIKSIAGEELAHDSEVAIRDEYSTLDWIMEGLLGRAGFTIDRAEYIEGFMAVYVCTK